MLAGRARSLPKWEKSLWKSGAGKNLRLLNPSLFTSKPTQPRSEI
jgi:hypothetical protein